MMYHWYETLNKPALTPPNWVFSPVWGILYLTIAVSVLVFYLSPPEKKPKLTTLILVLHLLSNIIWTPLFFGLHAPGIALVDNFFMDVSLAAVMVLFWKSNKFSSIILIPYFLWGLFATYLNFEIFRLN